MAAGICLSHAVLSTVRGHCSAVTGALVTGEESETVRGVCFTRFRSGYIEGIQNNWISKIVVSWLVTYGHLKWGASELYAVYDKGEVSFDSICTKVPLPPYLKPKFS